MVAEGAVAPTDWALDDLIRNTDDSDVTVVFEDGASIKTKLHALLLCKLFRNYFHSSPDPPSSFPAPGDYPFAQWKELVLWCEFNCSLGRLAELITHERLETMALDTRPDEAPLKLHDDTRAFLKKMAPEELATFIALADFVQAVPLQPAIAMFFAETLCGVESTKEMGALVGAEDGVDAHSAKELEAIEKENNFHDIV